MRFLLSAFVLPFLLLVPIAQATDFEELPEGMHTQPLIVLTNNKDAFVYNLHAMIDKNGQAAGMYKMEDRGKDGEIHDVYWMRDLESEAGVVLVNRSDRNAILLNGTIDRETKEGRFVIRYLTNGLSMSYESCNIDLKHDDKGWYVQNVYTGERVDHAFVETYFLGIKKIQGLCP